MTRYTTDRERLKKTDNTKSDPPWADVIHLELALRRENRELRKGIEYLANNSADEGQLLLRITKRWVDGWEISD